jgi:AraC-like DNA-binding protein
VTDRIEISRNLLLKLQALGLPAAEAFRRAGLSPRPGEDLVVSTAQMFSLWNVIAEISGDPAIGLRIGREFRSELYDPLSIVAYSASTFRQALQKLARYKRLCGAENMEVADQAGVVRVEIDWMYRAGAEPGLVLDAAMASTVEVGTRGTGRTVRPERIELRRSDDGLGTYERHFGCPVRYGSREDALVFAAWQADLAMLTRNSDLAALVEPKLESDLAERFGVTWADRVRAVLKRLLGGTRPTVGDVASELRQSSRTLQRRLAEEKIRFQDLLEEVRMALARKYLSDSSLSLVQVAYLVGYDEVNSFHRSFRTREGVAPGRWRNRRTAASDLRDVARP